MRLLTGLLAMGSAWGATVAGTVTNSVTGEPLGKVNFTLRNPTAQFAWSSDAEGKFEIKNVPEGNYVLMGEKTGFLRLGKRAWPSLVAGTVLTVTAEGMKDLRPTMTPQAVLVGRVVDEDGAPVEGATVRLGTNRGDELATIDAMETNDLGEFRFTRLDTGKYYVMTEYANQAVSTANIGFVKTYFPGTTDPKLALPVATTAGIETARQQITLRKGHVFSVRGSVKGAVANAEVQLTARDSTEWRTRVRRDGSFEFHNVAQGSYDLVVQVGQEQSVGLAHMRLTVAQSDLDDLVLTAQAPVRVQGVVKFDAASEILLEGTRINIFSENRVMGFADAPLAKDGTFQFPAVSRAQFRVNRFNVKDTYLKSVRLNGEDVTTAGPDFSGGGGTLEIVLGTKPAKLSGTVEPPWGTVLISLADGGPMPPTFERPMVTVEANGSFAYTSLPPGKYKLMAVEAYPLGQISSEKVTLVELKEGENAPVRLKLIRKMELEP